MAPLENIPTTLQQRYGNNAEVIDPRHAAPVEMLTYLVPWQFAAPLAWFLTLAAIIAVVYVVTTY
jgi:hypothetical protein